MVLCNAAAAAFEEEGRAGVPPPLRRSLEKRGIFWGSQPSLLLSLSVVLFVLWSLPFS